MKRIILIFLLTTWRFVLEAHPFYVGITQIDYKNNTLQITIKLFVDDLEAAIVGDNGKKLFLGDKLEDTSAAQKVETYIQNRFSINVNDKKIKAEYIGKEHDADVIWCYLEITDVDSISVLEVYNSLLIEKFESQSNIIYINAHNQKKTLLFNKDKTGEKITF